jgi:SNF2 family DNA or RNA helicase
MKCEKKIALTGTPLQNRVSELWSIFDFLMPGFLEEEQVFNKSNLFHLIWCFRVQSISDKQYQKVK